METGNERERAGDARETEPRSGGIAGEESGRYLRAVVVVGPTVITTACHLISIRWKVTCRHLFFRTKGKLVDHLINRVCCCSWYFLLGS